VEGKKSRAVQNGLFLAEDMLFEAVSSSEG
jgi:hypothetical protein